ncbi:MAG: phosphonoacetaldehyde hydrolase [Mangrovibacterium sp.]
MQNIKAVILDWAGTSVDYGCLGPAKVFVEVFKRWKIDLSVEQARGPMGLAKRDHTKALLEMPEVSEQWREIYGKLPGEKNVDEIYSQLEPAMADILKNFATPVPGTPEFLQNLKKQGIKVGSTTGYVASMMEKLIPEATRLGFTPDSIVSSSEVPAGRPFPYMCYLNAIRLQVYPLHKIVKIGDTVADIQEGLNAGMWTIGLTKSGNEVGLSLEEIERCDPLELKDRMNKAEKKLTEAGAHYVVEGIWDCLPVLEKISDRLSKGEMPVAVNL